VTLGTDSYILGEKDMESHNEALRVSKLRKLSLLGHVKLGIEVRTPAGQRVMSY